jgi:hypothetical protein
MQKLLLADNDDVLKQLRIRVTAVLAPELDRGNHKVAMDIAKQTRLFDAED